MSTSHLEREVTYEATGTFDPEDLGGLPSVKDVRQRPPEVLDAVYYDTADLRLLAHGCTLRRRTGGHDAGWHLKLPDGHGGRREFHAPLHAGKGKKAPAELRRRIAAYTRGGKLLAVAHLRTHRRRHVLLDAKNRPLAEVAEDDVTAQVMGVERLGDGPAARPAALSGPAAAAGGTSTRLVQWSEIEIELERADETLLRAATRAVEAGGHHRAADQSKLAHALTLALSPDAVATPARRAKAAKAGSAGEAVMRRYGEQLDVLLSVEASVRADEPDAVHRMRSAARRLRNLLRSNRRVLRRGRTDPVADELRWLVRRLAGARDHEVIAARLAKQARTLSRPGGARLAERVAAREEARRGGEQRHVLAVLDGPRHHALLDALEDLRAEPPLRKSRARRPARKHLGKTAARDQRRVETRVKRARKAPPGPARDAALHGARKSVRRLRHTAESAVPYAGGRAEKLRKRAKAVQQVLGEHQDAVMARSALPALAAEAAGSGSDAFNLGRLHAVQDACVRDSERALPKVWRRARRRKLTSFG